MATKQLMGERSTGDEVASEAGTEAMGPAVLASAASVGLSLYYYFVMGERERGIFVGLWPPTILAFASYFNQRQIDRKLSMLTEPGRSLRQAIDSVMGSN